MTRDCPFCEIAQGDPAGRILGQNRTAFYIKDAYPVSPGHTLIIPKRHVGSFFDTTADEKQDLLALLEIAKEASGHSYAIGGVARSAGGVNFNIGINDGPAAGQTVPHLHIHLIPRYAGDVADPRGGVRWVVPEKADYWSR